MQRVAEEHCVVSWWASLRRHHNRRQWLWEGICLSHYRVVKMVIKKRSPNLFQPLYHIFRHTDFISSNWANISYNSWMFMSGITSSFIFAYSQFVALRVLSWVSLGRNIILSLRLHGFILHSEDTPSNFRTDIVCPNFLWNNQQMQLYAGNFIPLPVTLYMFRVPYTPIIRSTIFNCIYSHWYKP